MTNYLVLTTANGGSFGRKVSRELRSLVAPMGGKVYRYRVGAIQTAFANHPEFTPTNTVIHCRAAHPTASWMVELTRLEVLGYRVINSTDTLKLTSDKWKFFDLTNRLNMMTETGGQVGTALAHKNDRTWLSRESLLRVTLGRYAQETGQLVLKPRFSQGQGQYVRYISIEDALDPVKLYAAMSDIPCNQVIVQEKLPVRAIYRVIIIGTKVFDRSITADYVRDDHQQVSVCLNREQAVLQTSMNPDLVARLRTFASRLQGTVGGDVNFIDIFKLTDSDDTLVVSEINTACSLNIHMRLTGVNYAAKIAEYVAGQGEFRPGERG